MKNQFTGTKSQETNTNEAATYIRVKKDLRDSKDEQRRCSQVFSFLDSNFSIDGSEYT